MRNLAQTVTLGSEFFTLIGRGIIIGRPYAIKTQLCHYGIRELASAIPRSSPRHGVENTASEYFTREEFRIAAWPLLAGREAPGSVEITFILRARLR